MGHLAKMDDVAFHAAVIAKGWEDPEFAAALSDAKWATLADFARSGGASGVDLNAFESFAMPANPVGALGRDHEQVLDADASSLREVKVGVPLYAGITGDAVCSIGCPTVNACPVPTDDGSITCACTVACG